MKGAGWTYQSIRQQNAQPPIFPMHTPTQIEIQTPQMQKKPNMHLRSLIETYQLGLVSPGYLSQLSDLEPGRPYNTATPNSIQPRLERGTLTFF